MCPDLFHQFFALHLNTGCVGLNKTNSFSTDELYFCDPIGIKTFASLDVDGIHFCFIEDFNEMVFVVIPLPSDDKYVKPLAYNFKDFLRLLLGCKNANTFDQISWMNRQQYDELTQSTINGLSKEEKEVLQAIENQLGLSPIADPYEYVKNLQKNFDYSLIQYRDEYYDTLGIEKEE